AKRSVGKEGWGPGGVVERRGGAGGGCAGGGGVVARGRPLGPALRCAGPRRRGASWWVVWGAVGVVVVRVGWGGVLWGRLGRGGANVLPLPGATLVSAACPRPADLPRGIGHPVDAREVSELHKAEASLTCMRLLLSCEARPVSNLAHQ